MAQARKRVASWLQERARLVRHAHQRRIPETETQRDEGSHGGLEIARSDLRRTLEQPHGKVRVLDDELAASEQIPQLRGRLCLRKVSQRLFRGGAHRR